MVVAVSVSMMMVMMIAVDACIDQLASEECFHGSVGVAFRSCADLYARLGYREVAIIPTVFNGIRSVNLVLLEKHLEVKP